MRFHMCRSLTLPTRQPLEETNKPGKHHAGLSHSLPPTVQCITFLLHLCKVKMKGDGHPLVLNPPLLDRCGGGGAAGEAYNLPV